MVWFEVKLSLVLYWNIWGGVSSNAMNLDACANSRVRVSYRLLMTIVRERTKCVFMGLGYLGVQCLFYVRSCIPIHTHLASCPSTKTISIND